MWLAHKIRDKLCILFHWILQKPEVIEASPQNTENNLIVNGDLEAAPEESVPVATVQTVQSESSTVELISEPPSAQQEPGPEIETILGVKKVEEALKVVETSDNSFIITPDYIQQSKLLTTPPSRSIWQNTNPRAFAAIKNALKQDDLTPEIEEKLLNLQRFQEKQMKSDPAQASLAHNHHEYSSATKHTPRKRPTSRTHEDDDWLVDTPKRRPPKASTHSDKKVSASAAAIETSVNRIIQSVEKETAADVKESKEASAPQKTSTPSPSKSNNNRRPTTAKRDSENKKEQQQLQVRMA